MGGFNIKKFIAGSVLLTVLVFFYNCWSFMCGRSTTSMLLDFSPPAIALIICNILVVMLLVLTKTCRLQSNSFNTCSCGKRLEADGWTYCPQCGQQIPH